MGNTEIISRPPGATMAARPTGIREWIFLSPAQPAYMLVLALSTPSDIMARQPQLEVVKR